MSRIPKLFDAHTHTHFAAYAKDSATVIERALGQNIWLVNVGTQKDTSAEAVRVANLYKEGVYATVGLHPIHTERSYHDSQELGVPPISNSRAAPRTELRSGAGELENNKSSGFTSRGEEFDYKYYKKLAENEKVIAIGECGLDYFRISNMESRILQKDVFVKHIELASEIGKPLMIHCRSAFADLIAILNSKFKILNSPPGIVHFFSGTIDDTKKLLELGFSFSFGGVITFARDYNEQIKFIPLDRILLETDAPYVTPVPYRGKRNEPAYIEEVAKKLAELKGLSFDEIAKKTTKNALKTFKLQK